MCSKDYEEVVFSTHEWNQLKDVTSVLAPFSEATDTTEGEKSVSMVFRTVLDLHTHLVKMEETRIQCWPLVKALCQPLIKWFSGIFGKTKMTKDSGGQDPFRYNLFFLATMLDPHFGLSWVALDIADRLNATPLMKFRDELKKTVTGIHTYILHQEKNIVRAVYYLIPADTVYPLI